jgi:transcriptional regulator with XRE-family HTH domain
LVECRRALVGCQIAGKFDRMEELAETIGISRSTVSRFFAGRPTSLIVTTKILAAMGLKFEDVLRPAKVLPRGNTGGKPDGALDDAA